MEQSASTSAAAGKTARRSQFIEKLHDLLENPGDPESLRWTPDGTSFEITSNEAKARAALAPKWDFRSLSSFIRQLSYYNFKRLSDRRRSTERRKSNTGFIVFTHPTGFFIRGDNSQLDGITRKSRNRPEKTRKASATSTGSAEDDFAPTPEWPPQATYSSYQPSGAGPSGFSNPFQYAHLQQPMPTYQPPVVPQQQGDYSGWRSYASPSWPPQQFAGGGGVQTYRAYEDNPSLLSPTYEPTELSYHQMRRTSLSDFKVGVSPKSKPADLPSVGASSYHPINAYPPPPTAGHDDSSAFHSSYPTAAYQAHLGSTGGGPFEQPHYHAADSSSSSAPSSAFRATGLAMYNPRGSVSAEVGGPSTATPSAPSTYSSYSASTLPPSLSLLPPQPHHPHSQHANEVLPSPTYSSEGEPPSLPQAHGGSSSLSQYTAPSSSLGAYSFPTSSLTPSTATATATQQSYLQHSSSVASTQGQNQGQTRSPLYPSPTSAQPLSHLTFLPHPSEKGGTPSPHQPHALIAQGQGQGGYAAVAAPSPGPKQQPAPAGTATNGLRWAPPPSAAELAAGGGTRGDGTGHWGETG